MQHEKLNTVEKRLAIYRELRLLYIDNKPIINVVGICGILANLNQISIYDFFEENLPELYQYRTKYTGDSYWESNTDRLAAIDKAIADCEKKLKNK